MSLHNVDKSDDGRANPEVNSNDVNYNRMAHSTHSIAPRAENTQSGGRVTEKNDQIIAHDGTNNRILFGRLPDGTWGIAISKPGVDVFTAF